MLHLNKLLAINSLIEKNDSKSDSKLFDFLYGLIINPIHAISARQLLNANLKSSSTLLMKLQALKDLYKFFIVDFKNKVDAYIEYSTLFNYLIALVAHLQYVKRGGVSKSFTGLYASVIEAEKQAAIDLIEKETMEQFFENFFEDSKETAIIYHDLLKELTEANERFITNRQTSTVIIEPNLLKFTPVTHAIYEKKTIYTPFSHPFHIVDPSPWPFCTSIGLWFIALNTIAMVHNYIEFNMVSFLMGVFYLLFSLAGWWRDVIRESTYEFKHTPYVRRGLLLGMMLFIISEVMFFFGFFWAFFHSSLVPSPAIGGVWPPVTIMVVSPWKLPLVNSFLLLLSGVTLTISHRCLVYLPYYNQGEFVIEKVIGLIMLWLRRTIYLGVFFLFCQAFEYYFASFTFQDTVYGGTFYILTGLHGLHVLVGTIFLIVCLWRTSLLHFTVWKQVGFKSAVWYWHFVDVVWIFLYLVLYVWGNAV